MAAVVAEMPLEQAEQILRSLHCDEVDGGRYDYHVAIEVLLAEYDRMRAAESWVAKMQEAVQREKEQIEAAHQRIVSTTTDPFRRAVLALHSPIPAGAMYADMHCNGCDTPTFDDERPDWPCTTYELARDWSGDV